MIIMRLVCIAGVMTATAADIGRVQAESPEWWATVPGSPVSTAVEEGDSVSLTEQDDSSRSGLKVPSSVFSEDSDHWLRRVSSGATDTECVDDTMAGGCSGPTWVQFTPYVWGTQVDADLTVNGLTAPLKLDLSDLWDLLKNGEVRGGFMGHLEFGRDDWSLFVNGDIISMDPSVSVRRLSIDTGLTATLLELGGTVNVITAGNNPDNPTTRLQLLGGVRYVAMDAYAIVSLPNINPVVQIAQGEQWVDPFVGGRLISAISEDVNFSVRGDVGGFGIGSCSDFAWNLTSGFTANCGAAADFVLGYRIFGIDQTLHGGTGAAQGFGFDGLVYGPVVGLTFKY